MTQSSFFILQSFTNYLSTHSAWASYRNPEHCILDPESVQQTQCSIARAENVCIDSQHKQRRPKLLCKIDLEKARIRSTRTDFIVSWGGWVKFRWRNWIKQGVSLATFSVLIISTLRGFFPSFRGLRQDDPLSPLHCVGEWSAHQMMRAGKGANLIKGFIRPWSLR